MSSDFSERAAKGQAYNLAISTAIADNKQHDNGYIVKQFLRHLAFAKLLQDTPSKHLALVAEEPEFIETIEKLSEQLMRGSI